MKSTCKGAAFAILFTAIPSIAQRLSNANYTSSQVHPGLSESCQAALDTDVSCPGFLLSTSASGTVLDDDRVNALCTPSCYSSLSSARAVIFSACMATTDVIVFDGVTYPATFVADQYLFSYNISCTRDSNGSFCDPQILSWRTKISVGPIEHCSECWLGVHALQLDSPLGYDEGLANNFMALTASCNATGYAYTSPAAYALNSTATTLPTSVVATASASCANAYTVRPNDSCNSIAQAFNVSTSSLIAKNDLDVYCQNLRPDTIMCIPLPCTTYTWQASDTCDSVVRNHTGFTVSQFLAWNPNFNSLCQNSASFTGYEICLSPPGGYLEHAMLSNVTSTSSLSTATVAIPTNVMQDVEDTCGHWYKVTHGDTCATISSAHHLSLSEFYALNPEIDTNCTNLKLGLAYCIRSAAPTMAYSDSWTVNGFSTTASSRPAYSLYTNTSSAYRTGAGTTPRCSSHPDYQQSTTILSTLQPQMT